MHSPAFRVDANTKNRFPRTPSVALSGDVICVTYACVDEAGQPDGVESVRLRADGTRIGEPSKVDAKESRGIEPVITAAGPGAFAVAWLEPFQGNYALRWRLQDGESEWQDIHYVNTTVFHAPKETADTENLEAIQGHISGIEIASNGENILLAWNQYGDGAERKPGVFAQLTDLDGSPIESNFRVTEQSAGPQAISVARGTRKVHMAEDQTIALAWHGDADLGDGSGVHLTVLGPEDVMTTEIAIAPRPLPANTSAMVFAPDGAEPTHEPPTFDRSQIDLDRTDSVNFGSGTGIDFLGITNTGWTPPDPEMAVGPNHVVAVTNGAIAWFTKSGTLQFQDEIEDSFGFWGAEGATGFVFDPEAIFDPHSQRFIAMANERSGSQSLFLIAISDDDDPNGTWYKYRIDVTSLIDSNIDSPNIGVDDEAIYLTADFFGPDRLFVYAIDKSSVLNGGTLSATNLTINSRHSMGTPVNYDANSPAQYLLWAPEFTTSSTIRITALSDPLGTFTSQFVEIPVPQFSHPDDPPQAGTSVRPELFEARFWSCVVRDGHIWATHHQGTPARVRWYQIALNGWPASGTPAVVQSGDVDSPSGVSTYFGSIAVNANGDMALTFAQSSATTPISMAHAGRSATDLPGTLQDTEVVITSTSPDTSGRWGDYSACSDDPADPSAFWGHHEYSIGGWRTRIASWSQCPGGVVPYCNTSPNSAGSGAVISSSGSVSISENNLQLLVLGAPPGEFGIFFYGEGQTAVPAGNGTLCVGSNFQRLQPAIQIDFFGIMAKNFDNTMPANPGGVILDGSTWNFQGWYRDTPTGSGTYNFSDALSVTFCP